MKHSNLPSEQSTQSSSTPPRSGYILPVFACAAAIAALQRINDPHVTLTSVPVNLIKPDMTVAIEIEQLAPLDNNSALAITRSDPGDNLDLTRHTPVWAWVTQRSLESHTDRIRIIGGEGIGKQVNQGNQAAIYHYATQLLITNLSQWIKPEQALDVTLILPEGRSLADRTSNAAFGVVEGLSLLGTSGISQPLSAPDQLTMFREELRQQSQNTDVLVFCIGENGLHLAKTMGIQSKQLVKTANWLGPLLAEAGTLNIRSLLLFGYHGKLIKLAGGIFHTHHYVADGRQEIFGAACVRAGLPTQEIQHILDSATIEDALSHLQQLDSSGETHWVETIYSLLTETIDRRSHQYICTHSEAHVKVGTLLFDRQRNIIQISQHGQAILKQVC